MYMYAKPTSRHQLVVFAIVMMVASALISFFFVHENEKVVNTLRASEMDMDAIIRHIWENANEVDRNTDSAVIVSLLTRNNATPETKAIADYYLAHGVKKPPAKASLMDLLKVAGAEREETIKRINTIYVNRLAIEEDRMKREERGSMWASIALFMQLAGLVLVILTREMPDA